MNRWSTAGFVPPPVYIGFPLFVLPKSRSREFSAVPWWRRRTDVCWASRTVEVPFGAAWPSFADAPPRPDPPVVCPGFGLGRFFSSTGLHRISFVRAFEESFRRAVFGTQLGTRDRCPLGEPNRRHPFRPGPAWPRRRAVHRPAPTRPWYVRVLDSTSFGYTKQMTLLGLPHF